MQQNENDQQQEEHEYQQNQNPLGEILQQNLPICKSTRPHRPSQRYSPLEYILLTDEGEPTCFQEACEGDNNIKWKKDMKEELKSLYDDKRWDFVEWPKERKILKNMCFHIIKHEGKGNQEIF